jgi:hypothetical protein
MDDGTSVGSRIRSAEALSREEERCATQVVTALKVNDTAALAKPWWWFIPSEVRSGRDSLVRAETALSML